MLLCPNSYSNPYLHSASYLKPHPGLSELTGTGLRCAWANMRNVVPEEAERGDFWLCDLAEVDQQPVRATTNAGRVGEALLSADGRTLLFQVREDIP